MSSSPGHAVDHLVHIMVAWRLWLDIVCCGYPFAKRMDPEMLTTHVGKSWSFFSCRSSTFFDYYEWMACTGYLANPATNEVIIDYHHIPFRLLLSEFVLGIGILYYDGLFSFFSSLADGWTTSFLLPSPLDLTFLWRTFFCFLLLWFPLSHLIHITHGWGYGRGNMVLVWMGMDGLRGQFGHEMEWNCKGGGVWNPERRERKQKIRDEIPFLDTMNKIKHIERHTHIPSEIHKQTHSDTTHTPHTLSQSEWTLSILDS